MIGFLYLLRRGVPMVTIRGLLELNDEFYCRPRRRRLTIEVCLDDYCMANAFKNNRSVCYQCRYGKNNRSHFGHGGLPESQKEDDE